MSGPLDHLRVVEISPTLTGMQVGGLLADLGAEVVTVEAPGGVPYRGEAGFPFLARGKQSIVLDLHQEADAEAARRLVDEADVFVTTLRAPALRRFGLDHETLSARNPRLVYAVATGWGETGPMAGTKGYEGLVLAKLGAMGSAFAGMSIRPGPSFVSVPYASWSATQTLLQGIFVALREREDSGAGQLVTSSLAQSLAAQDPWNQVGAWITSKFPDAFVAAPPIADDGVPNYSFTFRLLVAVTADGHWLQFSQAQPHLFRAFMKASGLEWMYDDPEWSTAPEFEDRQQRMRFWDILLTEVKKRTLAQWQEVFEHDPNVFAEVYRRGTALLHHPQMEFARQTVTITDPEHGPVLQPGQLIKLDRTPGELTGSAPALDEHGARIRARIAEADSAGRPVPSAPDAPVGKLPLAGVTILELGKIFAAPFGATMLTDLGARVIKIEPLEGEPARSMQPFPEAGGVRVLQGKESVALDLGSPESRPVLARIAEQADIVLCGFRAGAADRLGIGAKALLKLNPNLIYLDAPGYGIDGPYGHRPAFAPTMASGAGIAMRNAGTLVPDENVDDLAVIRARSVQLTYAVGPAVAQPDGLAALVVGTALSLGAYLQRIGMGGRHMLTTMLQTCAHVQGEEMLEYEGRPEPAKVDAQGFGLNARYRLYETAQGWVFLAVPSDGDWRDLTAVPAFAGLAADPRFATDEARKAHDAELTEGLAEVFATRPAADWERDLLAADVGCVMVDERPVEKNYMGEFGRAHGYTAEVDSPVLGEYTRVGPLVGFSRSATTATVGCSLGQHTRKVLGEVGYDEKAIEDLEARGVIACG
ncbi:CoA transferase [Actinocorallia sp. B10E7]|uniref:CaiB/BaiF CoA transferase family protein n=1 Tax=Actinocorallia sp. B10E7 TaxID=3153558 RepID=UPI00325F7131